MTEGTLTNLRQLYGDGRKVAAPAQAADIVELTWREIELEGEPEEKELQMQTLPGSAKENETLRSKVKRMRTAATRLQLESEAVFMVMEDILVLRDKKNHLGTEVTNLKNRNLSWKRNCVRRASMRRLPGYTRMRYGRNSSLSKRSLRQAV